MKLQKLTIHNIASIEDAVIDFEAQPLADSEVFLITGKTGAGKSTILDAICLALFANTPRLFNTEMQGDTKDGDKSVKIKDPRQLMRRNTGEAFVTLTFIGSNNIHYEALWAVSRARKKITGNMQPKNWQLKNLDSDYILTKDKEIEQEIKNAISLDFNQFCRTTMLAQGEFTRFLNSKDDEKAEILEKITGVDIYSKIGAKIFAITGQKERIWKEAQLHIEGTHTLTDAEIKEKTDALALLNLQYDEIKDLSKKETIKRDWIKTDIEYAKGITDACEGLKQAIEIIESERFKEKEKLVNEWNATIDARNWLTEVEKAHTNLKKREQELEKLADDFKELLGGQKFAEQEVGNIASEIEGIDKFLQSEKYKATVYENAQTIIGHLNTIYNGRQLIKKQESIISTEEQMLNNTLSPYLEKKRDEENNAKQAFEKEEAEVIAQEEAVAQLHLAELRKQRDNTKDQLAKIATAKERIDMLNQAITTRENTEKKLKEQYAAIEKKKELSKAMETTIHDAKIKMETKKEDLDKQSDSIQKFAKTLRTRLHIGDTCPVCRQKIMADIPHERELDALVSGLKNMYEEAEKSYNSLVEEQIKINAEIETESTSYTSNIKAFDEDTSVNDTKQKAIHICQELGIDEMDETTLSILEVTEKKTIEEKTDLDDKIKDGEDKEERVKKLRKELDKKRKDIEILTAHVQAEEKKVSDCNARITTAKALILSKQNEINSAILITKKLINTEDWQIDWKEYPNEFATHLTTATKLYDNNTKKIQTLTTKQETAKNNINNSATVIDLILKAMPAWRTIQPCKIEKIENLQNKANDINTSVTTALTHLEGAKEILKDNKDKLDCFLSTHNQLSIERLKQLNTYTSNDLINQDALLKKHRNDVVAKESLLENAKKMRNDHLERKPQMEETDTLDTLTVKIEDWDKQLAVIGEKKGAINQALQSDKENKDRLSTLIQDADAKKQDYQKWSRLNQLIGDATGNKFRKIAQSYVLTSLIHSANSYMKTLTDRYTLNVTPGTFVISLEDAYQGFVSRAASTISGGESFLVSLSLALALSDIGQTLSVDTLFIDEGFGTLSGEPLQNAINTLRSLHSKAGRHVGIISHVEELKERIPIQIQVNQEGNNSSSKIRIVPETGFTS